MRSKCSCLKANLTPISKYIYQKLNGYAKGISASNIKMLSSVTYSYTMDILKLRWIARFALKEGHSCRICHCVHFIVQFASALPSQPPLHLSPVPLPLLTCVVDLYSTISSDVLHDILYTNVLTRFGDYVLKNNHLNVQLY